MQTTLLGLAIAIILALVAALAGPLLIDWGNHRSLFEAEASRLIGVTVRVTGNIDARLLPSPRLRLHDIEIGNGADTVRARALGIEFALGSLMRGEWRAAEMHLAGPQLSLGLDASGRVRAPNMAVAFKPDELSIDRLSIEDGKITLADAASATSITLDRLWFNGEARSLAGPVKGEGAVTIDGRLYPFRVAAGRLSEDGALKLHINVDPVDHALSIEADGALALAGSAPHFDGTLSLSRPVGIRSRGAAQSAQGLTEPWRVSGKVKATAQSALIQEFEFQFGPEEQGVRLTGVADFKFGKRPRFDGVLSGRQVDLDRAVSSGESTRQPPAAAIRKLVELGAAAFRPALPIQIGIGIDQLTLGGNSVQSLRGDISSSGGVWNLDRFEFRAPGFTQVRLSGRLTVGAGGVAFAGPAEVDASDPKVLAAWLEGRAEGGGGDLRPLSLRGDLTLASDKVAIERFKAEFDRKPVTGRLAYFFASGNQPAKLDAEIKAAEIDIDSAIAFGRALLAGSTLERPQEMAIAAEIGRAMLAGIDVRDARARFTIDGRGLQVNRLSVADFGGGSFAASGRIDTAGQAPRGALAIDFETKRTGAIIALVNKFVPQGAARLASLFERVGHAKLHAALDIAGEGQTSAAVARLTLAGDIDGMRLNALALADGDWANRTTANVRIDGTIDAPVSMALTNLLGLDRFVATGKGPGQLKLQVAGPADREMALDVRVSADGLLAQANGRGQLSEDQGAKITATLQIQEADLRPLRPDAVEGSANSLPLKLTSRVAVAGSATTFDDIKAKLGGTSIAGRLAIDNNVHPRRIGGTLEADTADVTALIARAIGMAPHVASTGVAGIWSSEPFGNGALNEFTGKVAIKFLRAGLPPQLTARNLRATLIFGEDEFVLDDLTCDLAGGRFSGRIAFHGAKDGMIARAKVSLAGADIATLLSVPARPPVTGSLSFEADVEGAGLSPVALIGSLQGSGKIALTDGEFSGLDPRAFDAITHSVDQGLAIETGRVSDVVSKSLESGQLSLKHAEATIAINAGQLRLSNVSAETKDATLSVSGALDLTDGSLDARLALSGSAEAAGARPAIFMALKGPLNAPSRSIDVSALTGWLTLRAVENQTKRLRAIENIPAQPSGRPVPKNMKAPNLPAPIDIRPTPAPRSAGQPAASFGSQN